MYLPGEIDKARVLILVKTYPVPNSKYGETVCTAGLLNGENWVRIYPIAWNVLKDNQRYPKYSWITLDLVRNTSDFRQESYKPRQGFDEPIAVTEKLDTADGWAARKEYVLRDVFTSMQDLISLSKSEGGKSLATFKPAEIVDLVIEEEPEKDWKEKWLGQSKQTSIFDLDSEGIAKQRRLARKLPYRFKYKFVASGDAKSRALSIQDWEIGALFWNSLKQADGDLEVAKQQVRRKYFEEFTGDKDIYFFLGTHFVHQRKNAPDPFIIVGVFYPPKTAQLSLFERLGSK
jgi:hypothetical protein